MTAVIDWVNRCIFTAASTGTGSFVYSAIVTGYLSPNDAGCVDTYRYRYVAETRSHAQVVTAWEIGTGVYNASLGSFTRVVSKSSNANSTVNFSSAPTVEITLFGADVNLIINHAAIGADAGVDADVNGLDFSSNLMLSEEHTGDLSLKFHNFLAIENANFTHTGASEAFINGIINEPAITADSTGDFSEFLATLSFAYNRGSGDVGFITGIQADGFQQGSGTVNDTYGALAAAHVGNLSKAAGYANSTDVVGVGGRVELLNAATVTNVAVLEAQAVECYAGVNTVTTLAGVWIADQTAGFAGGGGSLSVTYKYNLYSVGDTALNLIEGRLSIGASAVDQGVDGQNTRLQLVSGNTLSSLVNYTYGAHAAASPFIFFKTRGANADTLSNVVDADVLGAQSFIGALGGNYRTAGRFNVEVDGTPSTQIPGRFVFKCATTTVAAEETFRINSGGVKVTGGAVINAAIATNATDGFLYIPTCAGPPTGTPTVQTGTVAMVYDTSNNKFYIYNGAWKGGTNPGVFT